MESRTAAFYNEIRKSHVAISYVDVIAPDRETERLLILDGDVQCDRSAQIRRSIRCNVVDPTGRITPRNTGEILTPYGTELRAYRGVRFADGSEELSPLGVFRLAKTSIAYESDGTAKISLEGYDKSRTIQRDKFVAPYVVESGVNVLSAIQEIVKRTIPDAEYDSITTSLTTTAPMLLDTGSDPWEACMNLAKSIGCEVYFDAVGRLAVVPPPDIHAQPAPVFEYVEDDRCVMINLARDFSDDTGFNGVVVTGESPGDEKPPVRGEAWDMVASSPTYRYGPYGEVPKFITDNTAKTAEDCEKIAKADLALSLGAPASLAVTGVVNPSYEAGDVVRVKLSRAGVDGLYSIDAFSVPFATSSSQGLTLRERSAA